VIPTIPFGRTGHDSSRVLFGAAALSRLDQETADTLLPLLIEHGVNHIDVAASYGEAELRLAPWLAEHRDEFFLATKTGDRTADGARASLERSLERLGVAQVDLIQLHNLVEEEDFATAHGKGGVVEGLVRARDEGLVRFIGVTGHGLRIPRMHLRSLERFDFDSVLFPYNFPLLQDAAYHADVEALIAECVARGVATQAIKSVARRRWPGPRPADRRSWYEPLSDEAAVRRGVRFVLGRERLFLNSSSDFHLLATILDEASHPSPAPSDAEMATDVDVYDMQALFDGGALERI